LIVDESPSLRAIEWGVVRETGLPLDGCIEAQDAASALTRLKEHADIDLVLVDAELPGAVELVRSVRTDPARARLPIALVSSRRPLPAHLASVRVNAFLSRPFTKDEAHGALAPLFPVRKRGG
jgi:CheY-like chemotaxis protein